MFGASSVPLTDGEVSLGPCVSLVIGDTETGFGVDPRSWRRVRQLFRARRFDVLHMHEPLMPLVPWFVLWQSTAPVVATFHTHREQGHRWYPRYRRIFEPLMRRVRIRLAVSDAARRTVSPHFPGEYEIVPNGIDVDRFARPAPRPPDMQPNQRHVLYVGRLEPRKGVEHLIHAMATVQRAAPDARLVVVGDGPDREGLETRGPPRGHRRDVRRPRAGRRVARLLSRGRPRLLAGARRRELRGRAARGDGGGAAHRRNEDRRLHGVARRAELARLVDAGDAAGLAREICSLLDDPGQARALGARAAARVWEYDWSAIANRLDEIYRGVTGPAAGPSDLPNQLRLNELTVEGGRANQLVMRPAVDDPALFEDDHAVHVRDGRQPMRDDDRRRMIFDGAQRLLHHRLEPRVERARRFVEDEDLRTPEQRAGDRQPLTLSARELHAAVADRGAEAAA